MSSFFETIDPQDGRRVVGAEAELMWHAFIRNGTSLRFARPAEPLVSIVIVSRNTARLLLWTLLKLLAQTALERTTFEVVLVDNDSDDDVRTILDRIEGAVVLRNESNAGFGPACNAGAAASRGTHLLFLNPDIALMPGAITALLETFADRSDVGIVGGRLVFPGGYLQEAGGYFLRDADITHHHGRGATDPFLPDHSFVREVSYVSGALLMVPRRLFDDLHGFDDHFAPAYFEDTDLCVRARQAGWRVMYQPRAIAIHIENATSADRTDVESLLDRNRRRFVDRHADWLESYSDAPQTVADRDETPHALRVLMIEDGIPHVDRGAGLPRTNAILQAMHRLGYKVSFYPMYHGDNDPSRIYRDIPDTVEVFAPEGLDGLQRLIAGRPNTYDVLWVGRRHNIGAVCHCLHDQDRGPRDFARSRVVFDTEAIFALREFNEACLTGSVADGATLSAALGNETRNFPQADHVVCVSESERRLIEAYAGIPATVLGHAIDEHAEAGGGFEARTGLLFVGALSADGQPNVDALDWFVGAILPALRRRLPDLVLTVVGQIAPAVRTRLARPGVEIVGRIADVTPYFDRARVFIAPTRYAAGVPHKVHEAMARGLPAVVTPILAEQVGWPDGSGYRIGDWHAGETFRDSILDLYTSGTLWEAVRRRGLDRVRSECGFPAYVARIKAICEAPLFT